MNRVLSKILRLFGFIDKTLTVLDFLVLLFVILLVIGALAYLLITAVF